MAGLGAARETDYPSLRVWTQKSRARAGEGGNKVAPAIILNGRGKMFNFIRRADDAKTVTQPLDNSTGAKDTSFKRILRLVIDPPRDRCDQFVLGDNWLGPGIHQHKAAGSIGILHHP